MLKSHKKTIFEALGRNPIHPFPARMAPGIALDALGEPKRSLRVLDPMAGSGTVLAVARARGHKAIGFDLDPLAVLLSKVWTRTIDPDRVLMKAIEVLERAMNMLVALPQEDTFPTNCDEETRAFVEYWFDEKARSQLACLSMTIRRVRNQTIRDALWCGFSRLIITKKSGASLAMDLSHSRPHRYFAKAPIEPFDKFISAVETIIANAPQSGTGNVGPASRVKQGDARHLDVKDGSIDLVLTSPPYLNAIDYLRCSKFSLIWMGYSISEIRRIRGESVGAELSLREATDAVWVKETIEALGLEPLLSTRNQGLLARYVWDMDKALAETYRVLATGGRAVYVVGDSTVRGTFICNSEIVAQVATRQGLKLISRHCRELPANRRYLPPPKAGESTASMDGRMREEVVLAFFKP